MAGNVEKTFWGGSSSGWMTRPLLKMATTGLVCSSEGGEGVDYTQIYFLQPYFSVFPRPLNNIFLSGCIDWKHNTSQWARRENHCKIEMLIKRYSDGLTQTQLTCVRVHACVCSYRPLVSAHNTTLMAILFVHPVWWPYSPFQQPQQRV